MTLKFPKKTEMLFKPSRYKVLYGGRGSGKSWSVARALLILGTSRPMRVLCARETQKSIADSVHKLLSDQIAAIDGLSDFYEIQKAAIYGKNGTEFVFSGLRDAASLKSFEGMDVCWVEEAQAVSEDSWEKLIPTVRKEGSEIWVTFNPEFEDDPTYTRFVLNTPDNCQIVKINWYDNPYFPEVLKIEAEALRRGNPKAYAHVWDGECVLAPEGAIFNIEHFKRYDNLEPLNYYDQIVHSWDTAFKDGELNDPSACTVWGCGKTHDHLLDCVNEKLTYPDLKRRLIKLCELYPPHALLIEDKASGQALIQEIRAETRLPVVAIEPRGNKETRAATCTPYIEAGRVWLPKSSDWLYIFEKQLSRFTPLQKNQHDDIVDSVSQYINWRLANPLNTDDILSAFDRMYRR